MIDRAGTTPPTLQQGWRSTAGGRSQGITQGHTWTRHGAATQVRSKWQAQRLLFTPQRCCEARDHTLQARSWGGHEGRHHCVRAAVVVPARHRNAVMCMDDAQEARGTMLACKRTHCCDNMMQRRLAQVTTANTYASMPRSPGQLQEKIDTQTRTEHTRRRATREPCGSPGFAQTHKTGWGVDAHSHWGCAREAQHQQPARLAAWATHHNRVCASALCACTGGRVDASSAAAAQGNQAHGRRTSMHNSFTTGTGGPLLRALWFELWHEPT